MFETPQEFLFSLLIVPKCGSMIVELLSVVRKLLLLLVSLHPKLFSNRREILKDMKTAFGLASEIIPKILVCFNLIFAFFNEVWSHF
jgi:hypothetical protein